MTISEANNKSSDSNKNIQNRLLDTAERLFAENGYEGTSIREITAAAECNVAAVNYHFSGKQKLYIEVFRRRLRCLVDIRLAAINKVMSEDGCKATLENLLRAFATAFIEPFAGQSRGRPFIKLMTREMFDQHLPKTMFSEEVIIPTTTALLQALKKLSPALHQSEAQLCIHSVIAQLIHVIHVKEMFAQGGDPNLPTFDLARLIDHIVDFSVAGIQACLEEKPE
ncbi:MAG: CerR family C-terminal domain-containing protein [Planctomycetota bacterium]